METCCGCHLAAFFSILFGIRGQPESGSKELRDFRDPGQQMAQWVRRRDRLMIGDADVVERRVTKVRRTTNDTVAASRIIKFIS